MKNKINKIERIHFLFGAEYESLWGGVGESYLPDSISMNERTSLIELQSAMIEKVQEMEDEEVAAEMLIGELIIMTMILEHPTEEDLRIQEEQEADQQREIESRFQRRDEGCPKASYFPFKDI